MEVRLRSCQSPVDKRPGGQNKWGTRAAETWRHLVSWRYFSPYHEVRLGQSLPCRGHRVSHAKPHYKALCGQAPNHLPRFTPPLIPFQIPPATTQMLMSNNLSNPPFSAGYFSPEWLCPLPAWKIRPHMFFTTPHMSSWSESFLIPLSLLLSTLVAYQNTAKNLLFLLFYYYDELSLPHPPFIKCLLCVRDCVKGFTWTFL